MTSRKKTYTSDWLSSRPIFYNKKTGKVSDNINDVIDYEQFSFHAEGLRNYLEFGYSVFEQTPVRNVKFLRHSSTMSQREDGSLCIEHNPDIVDEWIGRETSEEDLLHRLSTLMQKWEINVAGDIVIPTSGGYDSRLLNYFISDKNRIRSFTYGVSMRQRKSTECIYAKKLSDILHTNWEQIELGGYHQYLDAWDRLFGASTHAHGMYQIEFYKQISERVKSGSPLLSGIVGDAWAGGPKFVKINSADDVVKVGYSHGMNADPKQLLVKCGSEIKESFWEQHRKELNDPIYQMVHLVRMKIILLSYLVRIPDIFRFQSWSPFLVPEIALGMLTISPERRNNRIWQKEFFRKKGIEIEAFGFSADHSNTLNYEAIKICEPPALNANTLREIIKSDYVDWINKTLSKFTQRGIIPNIQWKKDGGTLKAYCAYLTLKPLENLIVRRDAYFRNFKKKNTIRGITNIKYNASAVQAENGMPSHYNEEYFKWQKGVGKFGGVANIFKFEKYIKPNDIVVDFGCGGGYLLKNLDCKRKIGIESNPAAIEVAKKNRIEIYNKSELLPDGIADVILSNHALEHVEDPIQELRTLRRKLKADGTVVFVVPYQDIAEGYSSGDKNFHLFSWNRQTLGNLFKCAGYEGIEIDLIQHQWPDNFQEVFQRKGEIEFYRICHEYAKKNKNYQIRIRARHGIHSSFTTIKSQALTSRNIPLVLVVYNRPGHTRKVLDAIKESGHRKLYIFSDGPKSEQDRLKVKETRKLIRQIDWVNPVIVERKINIGLARSIVSATNTVFETHDQLILLEDDCVPQQNFFDYMRTCLSKYESYDNVFGISGHTVTVPDDLLSNYPYDIYFSPRIGSWGWGTWKRAWKNFQYDLKAAFKKSIERKIDLSQGGTDIPPMILSMLQGQLKDVWTLNWILTVYLHHGCYIFPTCSHVRNIGTDGSGVHCGVTGKFDSPLSNRPAVRLPEQVRIDPAMMDNFRRYFDLKKSHVHKRT